MSETTTTPAIFAPLWKRKWLILAIAILVAAVTYEYYKRQPSVYAARTEIFLGNGAEEQAQLGSAKGASASKATSSANATNQAALINATEVKEAVRHRLMSEHTKSAHAALHGHATASVKEKNGEFITIATQAHSKRGAVLLANVAAQTYIRLQNARYQAGVRTGIAVTRRQLRRIEALEAEALTEPPATSPGAGSKNPGTSSKGSGTAAASHSINPSIAIQSANLNAKINQLETQLGVVVARQIEPATPKLAEQVAPEPKKNAIFGFAIGLLLACFAVYALSRLDRRLHSLADIEATLRAPLLTALPVVRRPIGKRDGQPVLAKSLTEPVRRLHMRLKLSEADAANVLDNGAQPRHRSILFVSADEGDGKSTLAAALALVQGDAGERVAVIEADFRRPVQAKLLDIRGSRGLGEVLEGRLAVDEAMQRVGRLFPAAGEINSAGHPGGGPATAVESSSAGSVSVMLGGQAVTDPVGRLAGPTMTDLLRSLADDFDYVLLDAPAPLQVSYVMPLLRAVDGIVIVARAGHTRENSAQRLVELLTGSASAPVLGVVANCVPDAEIERWGLYSPHAGRRWRRRLLAR